MIPHFLQRRLAFRKAANVPVWIEKGNDLLERCKLVNVSEKGARLTISDGYDLPDRINLYTARVPLTVRQCRVIWHRDHDVGVEFLETSGERRDQMTAKNRIAMHHIKERLVSRISHSWVTVLPQLMMAR
jgi:hypothetical protein